MNMIEGIIIAYLGMSVTAFAVLAVTFLVLGVGFALVSVEQRGIDALKINIAARCEYLWRSFKLRLIRRRFKKNWK